MDLDSADRPFDNIINFRDVGKSINTLMGREILREGVLFRSARLDDASERDKRRLLDEFRISTVVDLRSVTEHRMATQKRRQEQGLDSEAQQAALLLDADEHLVDLPGVRHVLVNLTGKAWERSLLWRLDWVNFFKVLGLATAGYRTDALKIVIGQVMAPRGLIGLGQDTIDFSTFEMKEVFDILANTTTTTIAKPNADEHKDGEEEKSAYPVLLHCTQGKDRTGLLILLLLFLTGKVPDEAISADYVRSEPELVVEAEERLKELHALGIPEEFLKCPAGFTGAFRTYLEERYGGVEGYLALIGIDAEMQERIRGVLVV